MSSSKKTSSKSRQSPAPATKSAAKPAPRKAPKAPKAAKARAVRRPAKPVPPAPAAPAAPAKLRIAPPTEVQTVISARVDVGFGNALFLRGEGPGLSWDLGVPLECVADDLWRIILPESHRGYTFKFLVNDLTWNSGPDYVAGAGESVTFTPRF